MISARNSPLAALKVVRKGSNEIGKFSGYFSSREKDSKVETLPAVCDVVEPKLPKHLSSGSAARQFRLRRRLQLVIVNIAFVY
jgi:hypothetical protein